MRIVSLACSNTEIVHALGCQHMLVGVDDHSDWPPTVVDELPKVGPDLHIDIGKVEALQPDLVLATLTVPGHEKVVDQLAAARLPFIAPEPVSLEDVYRDIEDIARLLDVPERGRRLVESMRWTINGPPLPTHAPTVLIQWWPRPVITPGRLSWATDVLAAAGARAVLAHEDVKSRPMTDMEVAEADPDAVVLSWCGVHPDKYRPDVVLENATWQWQRFVRHQRVFSVGEPFLGRPGPRLAYGFRQLRRIVGELPGGRSD